MKRLILAALVVVTSAFGARAQSSPAPSIQIEHAWARASAGKAGGAFLTIVNSGGSDDHLVGAETPAAAKAELHRTIEENGIMKMRPVAELEVKAGGKAELKPGGYHVMLTGLIAPLKEGASFPLTLTFAKAGKIATTVTVEKAGASSPAGAMGKMQM